MWLAAVYVLHPVFEAYERRETSSMNWFDKSGESAAEEPGVDATVGRADAVWYRGPEFQSPTDPGLYIGAARLASISTGRNTMDRLGLRRSGSCYDN